MKQTEENYANPLTKHNPSTLLDIQADVPIEIEVIWGEVVRMAEERKVDIPVGLQLSLLNLSHYFLCSAH